MGSMYRGPVSMASAAYPTNAADRVEQKHAKSALAMRKLHIAGRPVRVSR